MFLRTFENLSKQEELLWNSRKNYYRYVKGIDVTAGVGRPGKSVEKVNSVYESGERYPKRSILEKWQRCSMSALNILCLPMNYS